MSGKVVAGVMVAVAVFGAVVYFAREPGGRDVPVASPEAAAAPAESPAREAPLSVVPADAAPNRPTSSDPRLTALIGAPGNAVVEYIAGPDGRVIQEIDNDPSSQGYRKPLRDYLYAGDKLAGVTTYHYLGTQVQVRRALVTYKPDGSVDELREMTDYRTP